ncbi:hypothetical protein [Bosea sp. (in: a-proteobacteria)]|jgi:hypothetical protein|uniref:hypothetical protein n=1 Tax=Bosea sp. (in: a-proteobacteria) TaxID=1871050 RepID=UPI002DDD6A44|nr:hypothetical protein [Bosea sp. (in: a-proteobacteria)]HEV2511694.1 hypothetical protein [Bosea sp. (in: a-proteobacteria)]
MISHRPHLLPTLSRRGLLIGLAALPVPLPAFAANADTLTFDGLYKSFGVLGFQFSDRATSLRGKPVRMVGYMAPPLKPESHFFVLTREPLAICPFCQSDADWPVDIVVVFMRAATPMVSAGQKVAVSGRLEIGSSTDAETGFVSQIRLVDAGFHSV